MKRFILKTTVLALVAVAIANVLMLFCRDRMSLLSHERNVSLAYQRLAALRDSTKIVVIAGSNGAFSINSGMIRDAFHLPVVNAATHAGIGLRLQFEIYREFLRKGDIVVFCPEYGCAGKQRIYGESGLFRILSTHLPSAYVKMSVPQWLFMYKYMGIHFPDAWKHRKTKDVEGPYSAHALNEYGDIQWERPHKDSIAHYRVSDKADDLVMDFFQYVHSYTKEKGIHLIFLPPTFIESNFTEYVGQINSIAENFRRRGIPFQASPQRYAFPDSLYYDTPYHMTQEGADIRTSLVIEDMHRVLAR